MNQPLPGPSSKVNGSSNSRLTLKIGDLVAHPSFGVGTVCPKTARTHNDYVVVFFPDDPKKRPGSAGVKRRVRRDNLISVEAK